MLNKYKTKDGPYLAKLKSGALCQEATGSIVQFTSSKSNLLTSLEDNLKKRFSNTDTGVIKATTIVDHALWPSKDKKDKFGDKEVTYVVKHYEGSFLRAGVAVNSVEFEWTLLKNNLYSEPEEVKNLTWPEINRRWKSHYGNILAVVDLLLCLPSSSTECERGFSLIKNIKTDIRNSLKESSLCDFMENNLYSEPEEVKNLTWPEINRRWKSHYGNILAVVDLLLCLPSSSTECERGFSLIKNIKTDIRNSLKESSLCDFMVIQLESAPIESYDPMEAIHCWNKQPTRGRRPFLNNDGKSQCHPPLSDFPMAEPSG